MKFSSSADYFAPSFTSPLFRMRLSRYEATPEGEFGINPHVDTSFFTLLATTDHAGLVVFSPGKARWVRARHVEGTKKVNKVRRTIHEGGGDQKLT